MQKGNMIRAFLLSVLFGCVVFVIIALRQGDFGVTNRQGQSVGTPKESFFEQFFISGGPIVWFVLFPISLLTVYLAIEHALIINRKNLVPKGKCEDLIEQFKQTDKIRLNESLSDSSDLISTAVREGFDKGSSDWYHMRSAAFESLQEQAGRLLRRIEWLNLIGSVSPMIGLFGTVFGMIKLFNAIVASGGQPQPAQLADGIGVALVTTFWGLFAAIPALAVYGIFRNRIEVITSDAFSELEGLMPVLEQKLKHKKAASEKEEKIKWAKVPIINTNDSLEKKADKKIGSKGK
ncbi:MAG: MotA/TolQ/ExbB proton channel family protein [Sedimentisphaerales bacterium]|nr:MotA/TolQ/ExbB proton channel family protein [Sedimentisphaerales bacterium]